jgi:catechol 2,3-dioxygenase-like lactoylglutathione lyase family enzyme
MTQLPLCQVAISSTDLTRSHHWYRRTLGLEPAGERRHREGETFAKVPGLPEAAFDVWCLVDAQDFFQFELFEFGAPRVRTLPSDWRRCDLGYSTVGFQVADFDAALERISRTSGALSGPAIGPKGRRRACLRDPDGILLELMEDEVWPGERFAAGRAHGAIAVRSVSVSVADLERAARFWIGALGLSEAPCIALHGEEHEAMWGLEGARRESLVLRAGDCAVELVQYASPRGRPRPAGYMLSDQGILNVALGTTRLDDFRALYERVVAAGYHCNTEPWTLPGVATVVYVNDDQGFSVELLHVETQALERMGFRPPRMHAAA